MGSVHSSPTSQKASDESCVRGQVIRGDLPRFDEEKMDA